MLPDHVATIPDALAFWARATPDAPALLATDGRALSYRALHTGSERMARRLATLGVAPGARVAVVLPPGIDLCVALLGIVARAAAVPLDPAAAAAEQTRDLARLRPELLVTGGEPAAMTREIAARLAIPTIAAETLVAPGNPADLPRPLSTPGPGDVAVILHTSGTTALPKRVPRTHQMLVAIAGAARAAMALTPRDVLLLAAGVQHNLGLADFLVTLLTGGSCVVTPGFEPRACAGWLATYRPTWTVLTPTQLTLLLAEAASGRVMLAGPEARLRAVGAGAQALPPGLRERAEQALRAPVLADYGMTETGNIARSGLDPRDRREGSCGRSWGMAIRVVDGAGQDVAPGTAGEVVVRGATVFAGYLDDDAATAAAFLPGGWFRTGDLGVLDADGFLFLTGRRGELINRGGEKIAPAEVEQGLASHPAVAEAAVFAVPDARLGEDLVAAVVRQPGEAVTPRELREWLLARLAPGKVPRRIWFVPTLPRTPTGKVQRRVLAERFRAAAGAGGSLGSGEREECPS